MFNEKVILVSYVSPESTLPHMDYLDQLNFGTFNN